MVILTSVEYDINATWKEVNKLMLDIFTELYNITGKDSTHYVSTILRRT
jgi:hypothetical protein